MTNVTNTNKISLMQFTLILIFLINHLVYKMLKKKRKMAITIY